MGRYFSVAVCGAIALASVAGATPAEEIDPRVRRALRRLESGDENARHNAALDIVSAREKAASALEEIMKAIARDDSPRVKHNLLRAVGFIGAKAEPAITMTMPQRNTVSHPEFRVNTNEQPAATYTSMGAKINPTRSR